jgi:hypothetical protein
MAELLAASEAGDLHTVRRLLEEGRPADPVPDPVPSERELLASFAAHRTSSHPCPCPFTRSARAYAHAHLTPPHRTSTADPRLGLLACPSLNGILRVAGCSWSGRRGSESAP